MVYANWFETKDLCTDSLFFLWGYPWARQKKASHIFKTSRKTSNDRQAWRARGNLIMTWNLYSAFKGIPPY